MDAGFISAEDAAVGINTGKVFARGAAYDAEGGRAVVLVGTESGHLWERLCVRKGERWFIADWDSANSAGLSWSPWPIRDPGDTGVGRISGHAPDGAVALVARLRNEEVRAPVRGGFFVAAWWDAPWDALPEEATFVGPSGEPLEDALSGTKQELAEWRVALSERFQILRQRDHDSKRSG